MKKNLKFDALLTIKVTKEFSNKIGECARSYSMDKSEFVRFVVSEKLKKDGFM